VEDQILATQILHEKEEEKVAELKAIQEARSLKLV
jgi:hypothetical protein